MSLDADKFPRIRVAGIVLEEGRLLLARHEKEGAEYFLLPGGGVEWGESLDEALRREMLEETGLEVSVGPLVLVSDSIAPDGSRHMVQCAFMCETAGGELKSGQDSRLSGVCYTDMKDLRGLDFRPPLADELVRVLDEGSTGAGPYVGRVWN